MAGTKRFQVNLNLGFKDVPSQVALVRSAYLMMFYYFGYAYIRRDIAQAVRNQIAQPNTVTGVLDGVIWLNEEPVESNILAILKQPQDLQCFMLLFCLKRRAKYYYAVCLPGFNQDAEGIYERLSFAPLQTFDYTTIPFHQEFVADAKLKYMPEKLWYQVLQKAP